MQNEVSEPHTFSPFTLRINSCLIPLTLIIHSKDYARDASVTANFSLFFFSTVSYLVIFHIFLAMFIWSYWKTIGSRPAGPSKAVSGVSVKLLTQAKNTSYFHVKRVGFGKYTNSYNKTYNCTKKKKLCMTVQLKWTICYLLGFSPPVSSVCPEQRRNCMSERSEQRRSKRFWRKWPGIYPCIHAPQEEVRLSPQQQNSLF